jgi:hypothetical protein
VAAVRSEPIFPGRTPETLGSPSETQSGDSGGPPWPWIAGAALLVLGLGGTYLQNRNAAR